jgi:cyclopropane-fatty-acyl-phospholipid synthase
MNVESAAELAAVSPSSAAPSEGAARHWSSGDVGPQNFSASSDDGVSWPIERWLLRRIMTACGNPPVRIRLWDGIDIAPGEGAATGTVQIGNRRTLWRLLFDPRVVFGDAYSEGTLQVQGSLVDVLSAICAGVMRISAGGALERFVHRPRRTRTHSLADSRESVHHHYDIGNEFYRLWLDERMQYTCAYYAHSNFNLEQAQLAKLDHVCRKLQLQPGQSVVEAGCGWGGLALHMAERYGVSVRAFNLSREQVAFARERAASAGLARRVEFIQDDYRNVTGKYDAFVSVGMLEHVGREMFGELGRVIDRSLTPTGRGLIHSIGRNRPQPLDPWTVKRIFPGAYPPSLGEMLKIFEPFRLSVLDVENLRLHYARTLEHWLERFEYNIGKIAALFDDRFVRMWRMYLAGSIASFKVGSLQLFQVVFARESNNEIPMTRRHLYDADQCTPGLPA